jgi:hypothetical protein
MKLEKILQPLVTGKTRTPNNKYNSKVVQKASEALMAFRDTDLSTTEGLKAYRTQTEEDPNKYSVREISARKKARYEGGTKELLMYTYKHLGKVAEELDEPTQVNLGIKYCPNTDLNGNKPYNATTNTIRLNAKTIEKIDQEPDQFFDESIRGESDAMKHYMVKYEREFLTIAREEAAEDTAFAVIKYGPVKFLQVTGTHLRTQHDSAVKIENEMDQEIAVFRKNNGRPSALEVAKLTAKKRKELEKFPDAPRFLDYLGTTTTLAAETIAEAA